MKTVLKTLLKKFGYILIEEKYFPIGGRLELDIKRLRKGQDPKIIFDVGANIGQTVERFKISFPNSQIHSFEPVRETFKKLSESWSGVHNVTLNQLGLGEIEGDIDIYVSSASDTNSMQFKKGEKETVRVSTIDRQLAEKNLLHIDLLKIDTEGWDLNVLKGGIEALTNKRIGMILVETTFDTRLIQCSSFFELVNFLKDFSYLPYSFYDCARFKNKVRDGGAIAFCNVLFVCNQHETIN